MGLFPFSYHFPHLKMAELKMTQYRRLQALGAEPIPLPSEINFSSKEQLQKSSEADGMGRGRHHLPEFRSCGTYLHPNLIAYRLRVAKDRLKRYDGMLASETEMAKYENSRQGLLDDIKDEQTNLRATLTGKTPIGKILRSGEHNYPYRVVGMDYASILEDFEDSDKENHDIEVDLPPPAVSPTASPEAAQTPPEEERTATAKSWTEINALSDAELKEYMTLNGIKVHPATGREKRLAAIRTSLGEEKVNPDEPDLVTKAAAAEKVTPSEDLSSDDDE
jgi:hypothetical protein|tara:strand:- start:1114 stop:1947 length:834 start_codon:yes stop_codon:yes gene_type:complete